MIAVACRNVAVQTWPDGTVFVDTDYADRADDLVADIRNIARTPTRSVIHTDAQPSHDCQSGQRSQPGQTSSSKIVIPPIPLRTSVGAMCEIKPPAPMHSMWLFENTS